MLAKIFLLRAIRFKALFVLSCLYTSIACGQDRVVMPLRNNYPLALMHSSFRPDTAQLIAADSQQLSALWSWSNTLSLHQQGTFLIDAESRILDLYFKYGLSQNLELSFFLPLVWLGSGQLDPLIDDWHKTFGLPRGNRDQILDGGFEFFGETNEGDTFSLSPGGARLGLPEVAFKYPASQSLSFVFSTTFPLQGGYLGNTGIDLGVGALYDFDFEEFKFSSGVSARYFTDQKSYELIFPEMLYEAFLSSSYPLTDKLYFAVQIMFHSALSENIKYFPDYGTYLDTGFRYVFSDSISLDLILRENPAPRRGTTDVTFSLGLNYKL